MNGWLPLFALVQRQLSPYSQSSRIAPIVCWEAPVLESGYIDDSRSLCASFCVFRRIDLHVGSARGVPSRREGCSSCASEPYAWLITWLFFVSQVRRDVDKRTVAAFQADPGFKTRSLADLNREAASLYKVYAVCVQNGDHPSWHLCAVCSILI